MNPTLKPISVVLKEARKNKGISLEEAYKATKIHPNILRSLEEGTTLQLSAVYIKSYIKIYAKYLGISENELEQYFQPIASKEKRERKSVSDLFLKTKKEKIKNLALRASQFQLSSFLRFRMPQLRKICVIILVVFILFILIRLASNSRREVSLTSARQSSQKEIPTVKKMVPKSVAAKQEKAQKVVRPPVEDNLRLTLFADEDTWIQVRQDDLVVFRGVLKKFSSETWQAQERFELRINNAGTLKLELNGKILSPIGRKGQALPKVVITKEGLKIE